MEQTDTPQIVQRTKPKIYRVHLMEVWGLGGGLRETCEEKRRVGEPERACGITSTQKRARPR